MKILVAYDGSESSDAAIIDLRRAGLPEEAEAMVLTVAEVSPVACGGLGIMAAGPVMCLPESAVTEDSMEQELAETRHAAVQAAERLRADFPRWQIAIEAWVDAAAPAIIRKAHAWKPDLIVLGSHGRSGLNRLVLGSVSQHVLHHVDCSVRISRHRLHSQDRPPRLVIGVDGSQESEAAVRAVAARHWPKDTEAHVMAVVETGMLLTNPFTNTPETVPQAMEENWRKYLSEKVSTAVNVLRGIGLQVTHGLATGKACDVLLGEAEKWAADCLFVGARGLGGVGRLLLGSVSSTVAARAHCSVEVVRRA